MREVFKEDDDYENNSPVLLSVPQLEGPIVFMKEECSILHSVARMERYQG